MTHFRIVVSVAIAGLLIPTATARAQTAVPDSLFYSLVAPPSAFQYGCFGPCLCPVLVDAPLSGSFVLRRMRIDPLYTYYQVTDLRWKAPGPAGAILITGSGTYQTGGEVALTEQLSLDLSFNGGPAQHFDSGVRAPGAPFPEIDTRVSLHGEACHDSVLIVDAKPLGGVIGVGDDSATPALKAAPNPFDSSTEIRFTLAEETAVSLGVFDLSGRNVRALVTNQRLASGPQARVWDGRAESGANAPAGLYFVRLDTPSGRSTRVVAKVR